jgi:uncharacterized membrane protein YfcA
MNTLEFTVLVAGTSVLAGFVGALTGLGGGVVVVPFLTLCFGVDIKYAIGASLVSVIATSMGAAAAYVKEGFSNIRVGMFLEIATTAGALAGALIAGLVSSSAIAVIFGLVLVATAYSSTRSHQQVCPTDERPGVISRLRMDSSFPTPNGPRAYRVRAAPAGFGLMTMAGMLSGLLGIGSGALKVIAMDQVMCLPFKVSTATSNFMIGVTAAASTGIYLHRGYIDPGLTMPVMLGVLAGSLAGSKLLFAAPSKRLRILFAVVIVALGAEMIYNGITGRI